MLCCISFPSLAQEVSTRNGEKPFGFDFAYIGDLVTNTTGGVDQGAMYVGAGTLGFSFNPENANWWKGGLLRATAKATHGKSPSEELFGDRFFADNIDAGYHTYLYELWYKQRFADKFDITIGMQDINTNFATNIEGLTFVSTSIVMSTIFSNVNTPTFPLPGLGLELGWDISNSVRWQACVYDGHVGSLSENKHNLEWKLDKRDGYLIATEVQLRNEKAGTLKVGADVHTGDEKFAIYALGEHHFDHATLFAVAAFAPKKKNDIYTMINAGVNFHRIFAKRYEDVLGLSCVSNLLSDDEKHETIIELTYKYRALKMFYLQPDFQYIINPSAQPDLDNALGVIVRFGVEI